MCTGSPPQRLAGSQKQGRLCRVPVGQAWWLKWKPKPSWSATAATCSIALRRDPRPRFSNTLMDTLKERRVLAPNGALELVAPHPSKADATATATLCPVFDGGARRRGGLALRAVRGCGDGHRPIRERRTIGLHGGNVVSNPSSSVCAAHLARRALRSAGAAGDKAPVPLHWREVCRSVDDTRPADPLPALLRLRSRAAFRGCAGRWNAGAQLWYSAAEAARTAAAAASAGALPLAASFIGRHAPPGGGRNTSGG